MFGLGLSPNLVFKIKNVSNTSLDPLSLCNKTVTVVKLQESIVEFNPSGTSESENLSQINLVSKTD